MNYYSSLNSSPSSPPPSPSIPHFYAPRFPTHNNCHHYRYNHVRHPLASTVSCSLRRHHRRRRSPQKPKRPGPPSPPDEKLQMVIDIQNFSNKAPLSIRKILNSSELRFNEFVQSGNEAIADLTTLITTDADQRVIISCRPSTLRFMGSLVLFSCVIAFSFRVLVKLGSGFSGKMGFGNNSRLVRRRDRSLGGREVVVASKRDTHDSNFRVLETPLAPVRATGLKSSEEMQKSGIRRMDEKKLPSWWPVSSPPPVLTAEKQKYQTIANRLIRAIMDYRIAGKDILEDDIIQFRRLCRTSGARVSIDTNNGRDSFYRASVHVVFDHCGSAENHSTSVEIDGEDARQFIAGLADNIGLENTRAARIVSAAVAARTRSCFLQAWYGMGNEVSTSGDVYSYGILLLEMFIGKRPTDSMFSHGLTLHEFAKTALPERVVNVADPMLFEQREIREASSSGHITRNQSSPSSHKIQECLISILQAGINCSHIVLTDRPNITDVVSQLHLIRNTLLETGVHGGRRAHTAV